MTLATTNLMSQ